ncbi:MAG: hypothetical protein GYA33_07275 [Thermogutta sp.]|nr:hypothetical protein [Thermogutta sp.]
MGTVIKSGDSSAAREGVPFNFEDLTVRAERYLEGIRGEAAKIIASAHKEAVAVRKRAEEEGRLAARQESAKIAAADLERRLATLLPALREAVKQIEEAKQSFLSQWEKGAVRLAGAIAAKLVRREVERDPQVAWPLVREALESAAGAPHLRLRLHPLDHAALAPQAEKLLKELSPLGTAEIISDQAITRGGCRVETQFSVIDQQFERQLARIEEELTGT